MKFFRLIGGKDGVNLSDQIHWLTNLDQLDLSEILQLDIFLIAVNWNGEPRIISNPYYVWPKG